MSDHEDIRNQDDAHALSGAYAVDALDDIERARFEAHLQGCADCRLEVESLQEAAGALAFEPVSPPARLRAEVLTGIESIRPLPPLVGTGERPADAPAAPPRRRPWTWSTGPLLMAAALVVVALLTTVWLKPWASDDELGLSATERVLADPNREEEVQRFPDGSRATVVVSRSEGRAVIITEDMELAPEGKVYELWLQHDPEGPMRPAGLMPDQGDATVLLDGDASDAIAVGITVEPDGGSPVPSENPEDLVAVIELDA